MSTSIACASSARAQSSGADDPPFMHEPVKATLRSGFTLGLSLGPALVWTSGTPTQYQYRNDQYRVTLGPFLAPSITPFVGWALSDEVTFALGIEPVRESSSGVSISGTAFHFRIELFPFSSRGGVLAGLGLATRIGLGSERFNDSSGNQVAASGTYSMVGADLIWEKWRAGNWVLGPALGVVVRTSDTLTETNIGFTLRGAYHAGP
ncbi:MAG: hypothetical protein ACHREM_15510 [Polyangiales bacterium]